jgi:integrase/recombinase XerD
VSLIEQFLTERQANGASINTVKAYGSDLARLRDFLRIPDTFEGWRTLTPPLLHRWRDQMTESSSTIARRTAVARTFTVWLAARGVIANAVDSKRLRSPKIVRDPAPPLPMGDIERLFTAVGQRGGFLAMRDEAIVALMLATGISASEACLLNVEDVVGENRLRVLGLRRRSRTVPLPAWAFRYVDSYLRIARPPIVRGKATPALFLNQHGGRLTRGGLWANLSACGVMPSSLRSTFLAGKMASGYHAFEIMELAGLRSTSSLRAIQGLKAA